MSLTVDSRQFRATGPAFGSAPNGGRAPASFSLLRLFLSRQSALGRTKEGQLVIGILCQAWSDAEKDGYAAEFFENGNADLYCHLVGFEGDIQDVFRKHHPGNFTRSQIEAFKKDPALAGLAPLFKRLEASK